MQLTVDVHVQKELFRGSPFYVKLYHPTGDPNIAPFRPLPIETYVRLQDPECCATIAEVEAREQGTLLVVSAVFSRHYGLQHRQKYQVTLGPSPPAAKTVILEPLGTGFRPLHDASILVSLCGAVVGHHNTIPVPVVLHDTYASYRVRLVGEGGVRHDQVTIAKDFTQTLVAPSCITSSTETESMAIEACFGETARHVKTLLSRPQGMRMILSGPSGAGKKLLLKAISASLCFPLMIVTGSACAREVLKLARVAKDVIVVFDHIETLVPSTGADLATIQFLSSLVLQCSSAVVATTANLSSVHPTMRRSLGNVLTLENPTWGQRQAFLKFFITTKQARNILEEPILSQASTNGLSVDDLHRLCHDMTIGKPLRDALDNAKVNARLGRGFLQRSVDRVQWKEIRGLEFPKRVIQSLVSLMGGEIYNRKVFLPPPKGVLLFGPPGTGKTMLAKAAATQGNVGFYAMAIPDVMRAEVGESEKQIGEIFRLAKRGAPSILFLDELDGLFASGCGDGGLSEKMVYQLQFEIDALEGSRVMLLAASNHPEAIPERLTRAGRIELHLYVPAPTAAERAQMLERLPPCAVERTEGFTAADIVNLIRLATLSSLKRASSRGNQQNVMTPISVADVGDALSRMQRTMYGNMEEEYETFRRGHGCWLAELVWGSEGVSMRDLEDRFSRIDLLDV